MLLSGSSFSWPYMATMWHTMWRQLAAAWSTPYGFPPYLPSQFDFQRYQREAPEDAVTSSSEFQETEPTASEEYYGSRNRQSERVDPCPTFDPVSAFYPPKTNEHDFEANCDQKNAQKTSMMIDNLLNIRSESCSQPDLKWTLGYFGVSSDIVQVILFLCNILSLDIFNIVNKMFLLYCKMYI